MHALTPAALESRHVHSVYNEIASHFSATRHSPWPVVASFLLSLPPHSFGADVGCGNGKYLTVNERLYIMASDYSQAFCDIVNERGKASKIEGKVGHLNVLKDISSVAEKKEKDKHLNFDIQRADALSLPYKSNIFDFCISIAVIHHFSTSERRGDAVKELVRVLRVGGQGLVFVWALSQTVY